MSVSSARPDDLHAFASKSRTADEELRRRETTIKALYGQFRAGTSWGRLEADSLLSGFGQYISLNEVDAAWVARIAAAFRAAGGDGSISRLPDAAIRASLRAAGLDGGRQSVTFDEPTAFGLPPTTGYAADPVNTASGNFIELENDLPFAGLVEGLSFTRTYNSRSDRVGAFGPGWGSWATARLRPRPDGVEYEGPDGQRALFPRLGPGYGRVLGVNALVEPLPTGLALRWFDGRRWDFDETGLPVRLQNGPGTEIRLRYQDGRLVELFHRGGKRLTLDWDAERITGLGCSDGRRVSYGYDAAGHLVEADGPAGRRRYDVDADGRVRSVVDADGVVEVVNTYDGAGRVLLQLSRFGRRTSFAYLPGRVTVTGDDSGGPSNTYLHDQHGRLLGVIDGHDQRLSTNYDQWGNPVAITERNGATTVQEWDARARLTRRVLPTGAAFTYTYDDADRVVEVASSGSVTRYRYDGEERHPAEVIDAEGGVTHLTVTGGLIRKVVDPDGVEVRFEFDPDGNITTVIDGNGNAAHLERDAAGRVTAAVTPSGRRTTFAYDAHGRPVERHDAAGGLWRYQYTPGGRLTSIADPTGAREEIRYGPHGDPAAVVDPLGHATTSRYDVFGNVVAMVAPDGAKWEMRYDALSRLTTITDPAGATWLREYDVNGNVTATIDPVGVRRTLTYDPAGRVSAVSDGLTSTHLEVDPLGRVLAQHRPDGSRTRAGYDRCGRCTIMEDPAGGITRVDYTSAGRVRRLVQPSGRVKEYEYDACGRPVAHIDGAGRRWQYRYDPDGLLIQRITPTGETECLTYDPAGRLTERAASGLGTTSYVHDAAGRPVAITDRVHGTRHFTYDPAGRLVAATDANGGVTGYAYNERGWLTAITDPMGGVVMRRYDEVGRLVIDSDPLGRTTTLTYDPAGQLIERVDGSGASLRWSYDLAGRITAFGPTGQPPVTIVRDALGRPVALDEPDSFRHQLRWDRAGRLIERRRDDLALRWRYDHDGRRAAVEYPDGTETTYSYDAGGFLIGLRHPAVGVIQLDHDPSGRLVGAIGDGMRARWHYHGGDLIGYDVDADEARRSTRLSRDGRGRLDTATVDGHLRRYAYDASGQLVSATTPDGSFTFAYDANGRLVNETSPVGTVEYEYDAAGQLVCRRDAGMETRYQYDGAGRRASGTGTDPGDPDSTSQAAADGGSSRIVVDALGELAEVNGSPLLWDTADPLKPLCWLDGQAVIGHGSPWVVAGAHEVKWLAPDWQGTVGEARDPWGAPISTAGAGTDPAPRLGYRGELEFGGTVWLRNRVYEPATRAFLQPDLFPPVPGTPGAANPYHYGGNNPIDLLDPLGLRPVTDAELRRYHTEMGINLWDRAVEWAPGAVDTAKRLVTSYAKGVWVDGAWGTVKGLYGMVNFTDWETFKASWTGIGKLALSFTPVATVNAFTDLPGLERGELARTQIETGKALLAWDMWEEDPARALGQVVFGAVEVLVGTKGAGAGAKAASAVRKSKKAKDGNGDSEADETPEGPELPPGAPSPESIHLPLADSRHILDGDERGGGHRAGAGRPKRTEFPADWSEGQILQAIEDVARRPDEFISGPRPGRDGDQLYVYRGVRNGVNIEVVVNQDGRIVSGFPREGEGVFKNPPAPVRPRRIPQGVTPRYIRPTDTEPGMWRYSGKREREWVDAIVGEDGRWIRDEPYSGPGG